MVAPIVGKDHRHALGLPLVPGADQPLGIFKHLRIGPAACSSLLVRSLPALVLHFSAVKPMAVSLLNVKASQQVGMSVSEKSGHCSDIANRLSLTLDRGRDASYLAPPAQIRTGPIRAYGSHLGCLTAKRTLGQG